MTGDLPMKAWMCMNCGWVYRQEAGDPDGGIAPGTHWDAIPEEWQCPDCGAMKADFAMEEI